MANYLLKQHWRGVPSEEIGPVMQIPLTVEQFDLNIESELKRIEDGALDGVIKRAKDGEVAAVEWLEARGLIRMPGKQRNERSEPNSES